MLTAKVLVLTGLACLSAAAQAPAVDVFGGYSYVRSDLGPDIGRHNLSGWDAAATFDVTRHAGLTARVTGDYGRQVLDGFGLDTRAYSLLFGPRVASRLYGRFVPFAYAQAGVAWISGSLEDFPEAAESDNSFAAALGGGLDVNLREHLAVRAFQAEWFMTRSRLLLRDTQQHFRLSAGIVFNFGRR